MVNLHIIELKYLKSNRNEIYSKLTNAANEIFHKISGFEKMYIYIFIKYIVRVICFIFGVLI